MQTEFDARGSRRGDLADMGRTLRGSEQGGAAPVHEAGKGLGEDWHGQFETGARIGGVGRDENGE